MVENIEEADLNIVLPMIEGQQSAPGQLNVHRIQDDPNNPLKGFAVPLEGDQLTRERFSGAGDLVAEGPTAAERFDHTSPHSCALWHRKASFLQVTLDFLRHLCFHFYEF